MNNSPSCKNEDFREKSAAHELFCRVSGKTGKLRIKNISAADREKVGKRRDDEKPDGGP